MRLGAVARTRTVRPSGRELNSATGAVLPDDAYETRCTLPPKYSSQYSALVPFHGPKPMVTGSTTPDRNVSRV